MMRWFRLPYQYLRYYKKQTIALWLGILLSAALFTGIGSLLGSGRIATTNKAISQYGRWQYSFGINNEQVQMLEELKNKKCSQHKMEKVGIITIRKTIEEPFEIELVHGNSDYMEMMGRTLISGKLPSKEDEVAMDIHTLNNLDVPKEIGRKVEYDEVCNSDAKKEFTGDNGQCSSKCTIKNTPKRTTKKRKQSKKNR